MLCGPPASPTLAQVVVEEVTEQAKTKPELIGLAVYLEVCTHYSSVFVPGKSPLDIIKSLGCVVYFMRIWDTWLREKHGTARDAEACCVTSACRTDLEISAACVINLLAFVHDCPDMVKLQEICTSEFGSDVCEDLFGFFGTWRSNSRVYSAVAARDKVRASLCVHALSTAYHTWLAPRVLRPFQRTPGWGHWLACPCHERQEREGDHPEAITPANPGAARCAFYLFEKLNRASETHRELGYVHWYHDSHCLISQNKSDNGRPRVVPVCLSRST